MYTYGKTQTVVTWEKRFRRAFECKREEMTVGWKELRYWKIIDCNNFVNY